MHSFSTYPKEIQKTILRVRILYGRSRHALKRIFLEVGVSSIQNHDPCMRNIFQRPDPKKFIPKDCNRARFARILDWCNFETLCRCGLAAQEAVNLANSHASLCRFDMLQFGVETG